MALNVVIPQKNTGDTRTALEDNQITDFTVAPLQSLSTFDGSLILIDGTGSYTNFTMSANLTVTFAESAHEEGNIKIVKITSDGTDTLTFIKPAAYVLTIPNNLTNGGLLPTGTYIFGFIFKNGEIEVIQNIKQSITDVIPTVSSMSVEDANPNDLLVNLSESCTFTNLGGTFRVDATPRTLSAVSGSPGTVQTFTISGAAIENGKVLDFAYDSGTGDTLAVAVPNNELATFTATTVNNNVIGATQLTALTINDRFPGGGKIQIDFTNPNSGNEDQNQIYFKLDTEPTIWTAGVVVATSGTTGTQTGLTNALAYDIKIVAEGSGSFSDSNDSNIVTATPRVPITNTKSFAFNGSDQYVHRNQKQSEFEPIGADAKITYSWWMKGNVQNVHRMPFTISDDQSANNQRVTAFWLESDNGSFPDDLWLTVYGTDNVKLLQLKSTAPVTTGTWHHIAFTFDETTKTIELYVDGIKDVATTIDATSFDSYSDKASNRFIIGAVNSNIGFINDYDGLADEFAIYDKVLSEAEVREIYNLGEPIDLSVLNSYVNAKAWFRAEDDYTDTKGSLDLTNNGSTFNVDTP